MDTRVTDKTLIAFRMDLLAPAARRCVEDALAADAALARRLALLDEGLAVRPVADRDTAAVRERIDARLAAQDRAATRADARLARPRRRPPVPVLAAAAGLALAFVGWRVLTAPVAGPAWTVAALPSGASVTGADGLALNPGARLFVPADRRVDAALGDVARLAFSGPGELELAAADKRTVAWKLGRGTLEIDARRHSFDSFRVTTGEAAIEVTGTRFTVRATDGRTVVDVAEGEVRVTAGRAGATRAVPAGKSASADSRGLVDGDAPGRDAAGNGVDAAGTKTETVFLHDGSVFKGRIVSQDGASLTIETARGTFRLDKAQVKHVEYRK